jgi:DNA primase catalytic core
MDWVQETRSIKKANRLEAVASEFGVALKKQGKELIGRCPFGEHEDKHPSFSINPKKQLFYCHGCGRGGDVFSFVMVYKDYSFAQARYLLAERTGTKIRVEDQGWSFLDFEEVFEAAVQFWQYKLTKKHLRRVQKKWGVKPETAGVLRLGYADPGTYKHLRMWGYSKKELEKSGLFRRSGHKLRLFLRRRIIFPVTKDGRLVNLVGRALPLSGESKPKFLKLENDDDERPRFGLYNVDSVRADKALWIVEGYGDAAALHQMGFSVIAIGGTNVSAVGMDQLAKYSAKASRTYIFFDFDDAGFAAARKLARHLLQRGIHAWLVLHPPYSLPIEVDDPAAIVCHFQGNKDKIKAVLTDGKPFVNVVLDSLPTEIRASDLTSMLQEPLELLAMLDPVVSHVYVKALAKKFKLPKRELLKKLKHIPHQSTKGNAFNEQEDGHPYCEIEPSLGRIDSLSYFIIPVSKRVGPAVTLEPFMVTSDKEFIRVAEDADAEVHGKKIMLRSMPLFTQRESRWEQQRLRKFLTEPKKVNPRSLFLALRRQAKRYLEFQEAEIPDLLAVWIMGTYLHPHFDTYPYLQLYGPKGSGKTKTLTLLFATSFNAVVSSSIKPAGLFRVIERSGATLLLDEAERLNSKESPELAELLRAGYKKPSVAIRVQEKNFEPRFFNVFGPKAIANIKGLDDVLGSRCIPISMVRSLDRAKVNRDITPGSEMWAALRSRLYRLALDHSSAIHEAYVQTKRSEKNSNIHGRNFELWAPMFAVAAFLKDRGCKRVLTRLHQLAERKVEEHRVSSLDDWDTSLLLALYQLTADADVQITTTKVKYAMERLLPTDEGFKPSSKWIGKAIHRFGLGAGKKTMGTYKYRISRAAVIDLLKRYEIEHADPHKETMDQRLAGVREKADKP